MNYNLLNTSEILRIAQPETDLEIRLIEILNDDALQSDDLAEEVRGLQSEMEDMYSNDEGRGMISDLEDRDEDIKRLEKLLDDNNIEHDESIDH